MDSQIFDRMGGLNETKIKKHQIDEDEGDDEDEINIFIDQLDPDDVEDLKCNRSLKPVWQNVVKVIEDQIASFSFFDVSRSYNSECGLYINNLNNGNDKSILVTQKFMLSGSGNKYDQSDAVALIKQLFEMKEFDHTCILFKD